MANAGEVPTHWTKTAAGKIVIGVFATAVVGGGVYGAVQLNRVTESITGGSDDKHDEAPRDSSDGSSISGKEAKNRIKDALDAAGLLIGEQTGIGTGQFTPGNETAAAEHLEDVREDYAANHPDASDAAAETAAYCSYIPHLPKGAVGQVVTEGMVVTVEIGAGEGGSSAAGGTCKDIVIPAAPGHELPRLNLG